LNLTDDWMIAVSFKPFDTSTRGTLISKDGVGTDTTWAYNVYVGNNIEYEVNNQWSTR
jgi:hypothetical protein